jgi:cysteine desulfurase
MFGGAHENQRRPGTENTAGIAGMAAAADWTLHGLDAEQNREAEMRDRLWLGLSAAAPGVQQNADSGRLANTLNVSFPSIDSETMLMALDLEGVCASSGSACMVGSVVASHVLLAMGLSPERASSAIRFSLGRQTTIEEIDATVRAVAKIMDRLSKTKSARANYAVV